MTESIKVGRLDRAHIEVKADARNPQDTLDVTVLNARGICVATTRIGVSCSKYSVGTVTQYSLNANEKKDSEAIATIFRVLSFERAQKLIEKFRWSQS